MFSLIVATDNNYGIGKNNKIPWINKEDMAYFRAKTLNNVVIMGRKTYESIGKPLSNRINIVISKTLKTNNNDLLIFSDIWECVKECYKNFSELECFVIGGEEIYSAFLKYRLIKTIYWNKIKKNYDCDKFLRIRDKKYYDIKGDFFESQFDVINCITEAHVLQYANNEEKKMLGLMREILEVGETRDERTGTGAKSLFGKQFEFCLRDHKFPLMTSKKLSLRFIFEELMFYLRGQTDNTVLEKKNIYVWTPNTSRKFLDGRGLNDLPVGDMGHSYGFSFRHFGAQYVDCNTDYTGKGFDQIKYLIKEMKENPTSRRLRISLWEPNHMHKAALPPCLEQYQFYVSNDGYLDCMMTQRSSDFFTAGGWNVATGALLTYLLAHFCDLKPNRLVWNIGDIHIYNNLVEQVETQLSRVCHNYPFLFINGDPKKIEDFQYENLELVGYKAEPHIKGILNV